MIGILDPQGWVVRDKLTAIANHDPQLKSPSRKSRVYHQSAYMTETMTEGSVKRQKRKGRVGRPFRSWRCTMHCNSNFLKTEIIIVCKHSFSCRRNGYSLSKRMCLCYNLLSPAYNLASVFAPNSEVSINWENVGIEGHQFLRAHVRRAEDVKV